MRFSHYFFFPFLWVSIYINSTQREFYSRSRYKTANTHQNTKRYDISGNGINHYPFTKKRNSTATIIELLFVVENFLHHQIHEVKLTLVHTEILSWNVNFYLHITGSHQGRIRSVAN